MNNNNVEIISLIYGDDRQGISSACSEIRHDRNRASAYGRLGYYLNGRYLDDPEINEQFFGFLRGCPISRSISIDARFLDNDEIMEILRNAPDLREVRIIGEGYVLTNEVLNRFSDNVLVICDEVSDDIGEQDRNRVYAQHGLFVKETNYVEDDLVSAYFITRELSDGELDYLVNLVNNDNSADYSQISFRVYNPALYRDLVTRLHERGLREDVRINFLANPLYDRSEAYDGLSEIASNPINITYDTCSDMVDFYTGEPYTVSNAHRSELEGGGKSSLDSYTGMLRILEEQEAHIREQEYSPLEAAIYAYRFLQRNYAYDPNIRATDAENVLTNRQLDIVAGNSTMVCEGYATLYSALMRRCGIPMFRYSTDIHVRNIGRIVDDKYGVDMIGVADPTFDGSHLLADNSFDESRRFEYFMFSPREAIYFDPYVTLATSLVLDYEAICGSNYLPLMSGDLYEDAFTFNYLADGYAMTMLDRMGIQLPEDLSLDTYRELVANLNRTTLFDSINPDAFVEAYQHVLRREEPELSEFEVLSHGRDALLSMMDRLDRINGVLPEVLVNRTGEETYLPALIYPMENTLSISDFNKPVAQPETGRPVVNDSGAGSSSTETPVEEPVAAEDGITGSTGTPVDGGNSANDGHVNDAHGTGAPTGGVTIEVTIEIDQGGNGGTGLSDGDVSDVIDGAMDAIDVNSDEFIPGTRIRKPRPRGDYETDEEYVAYLADYYGRYFPRAAEETREQDSTYSLRRDQIIQDLPIYSRAESRFNGTMTPEEIEVSRAKLR